MELDLYLAFVAATALLIIIPGPAVTFIVATSLSYGSRAALTGVAGSSSALALQMLFVILGMSSLLVLLADWFEWLRWFGVAYLVYLGIRQWRAPAVVLEDVPANSIPKGKLFIRGFIVNGTNPKTFLFLAAFFPQFLDMSAPLTPQLVILCTTFLVIATVLDSAYALAAGRLRGYFNSHRRAKFRNRIAALLLMGAGAGLALARKSG